MEVTSVKALSLMLNSHTFVGVVKCFSRIFFCVVAPVVYHIAYFHLIRVLGRKKSREGVGLKDGHETFPTFLSVK